MKKSGCFIALALLGFCCSAFAQNDSSAASAKVCSVDSLVFATAVASRVPSGTATEFEATVGKVFCWTRLSAKQMPLTIKYVWYNGDQKVGEVPITLKVESGRFWTNKTVASGTWKVEVQSDSGVVLGSGNFTVK